MSRSCPASGIAQGPMALDLHALAASRKPTVQYPEDGPPRSRRAIAAGCCCCTTRPARSSARPASSAPGLPHRVHRHGRRGHARPLPRPLGPRRAVRRAARGVGPAPLRPPGPRPARSTPFAPIDLGAARRDPGRRGLRPAPHAGASWSRTQEAYGHLPVAALQHISHQTGAWYSELYGIATFYPHLRFEPRPAATCWRSAAAPPARCCGAGRVLRRVPGRRSARTLGGVSPDGAVRLEATDCRGELAAAAVYVTLDGAVQPHATAKELTDRRTRCAPAVRRQGRAWHDR